MIAINFKTYSQGTGEKAVDLAKICVRVSQDTGVRVVGIPQIADLRACVQVGAECWVQHVDEFTPGKNTGYVIAESAVSAGASGTLLNHSEHRLEAEILEKTCQRLRSMDRKFEICICVQNTDEAIELGKLSPNFIAYEPPELIGSRNKSVATEKPEIIKQVTDSIDVPVLIGAGVHTGQDVRVGLALGAKGILLASDIMLAENPEKELRELAEAFTRV